MHAVPDPPGESAPALTIDEDVLPLLPKYIVFMKQYCEEARAACRESNHDAVARLGHQIKGSGGSYGFPPISRMGGELEAAAKAGDSARVESWIAAILAYVNTTVAAHVPK